MTSKSQELATWLEQMPSQQDFRYELKKYAGIKDWALEQIGFKVGDRVTLTKRVDFNKSYGWRGFEETMEPGQPARIVNIDWNAVYNYWYANVEFEAEWTVDTFGKPEEKCADGKLRTWNGAKGTKPEGYRLRYDHKETGEHKHHFGFAISWLKKIAEEPTAPPVTCAHCPGCKAEA